jgi:hypothetical protein
MILLLTGATYSQAMHLLCLSLYILFLSINALPCGWTATQVKDQGQIIYSSKNTLQQTWMIHSQSLSCNIYIIALHFNMRTLDFYLHVSTTFSIHVRKLHNLCAKTEEIVNFLPYPFKPSIKGERSIWMVLVTKCNAGQQVPWRSLCVHTNLPM